jgi:hypothetical protein
MNYYREQFGEPAYNFEIPFPFDRNELKDIPLYEVISLGKPFKKIYQKSFRQIKDNSLKIHNLKDDIFQRKQVIAEQQRHLLTISDELIGVKKKISLWKDFARPKFGETLCWTGIEVALGFLPIPIPTSPFSHLLQIRQYHKKEEELKDD